MSADKATTSPDANTLGRLLERCATKPLQVGEGHQWMPHEGSEAAVAAASNSAHAAYAGAWVLIVAACSHLHAMATLLQQTRDPVWSLIPLARAATDTAVRAWWVLEPDLDLVTRLARGYELFRLAVASTGKIPDYDGQHEEWRRLRTFLNRDGVPMSPPGDTGQINKIAEVVPPTDWGNLYRELFEDEAFAARVHGWFAGIGHGDVWLLSEFLDSRPLGQHRTVLTPRTQLAYAAGGTRIGVEAVTRAFDRWCALQKWDNWEKWSRYFRRRAEELLDQSRGADGRG